MNQAAANLGTVTETEQLHTKNQALREEAWQLQESMTNYQTKLTEVQAAV